MKNVYHIARRELGSYFVSPIAYVVIAIYLAVVGGLWGVLYALYRKRIFLKV